MIGLDYFRLAGLRLVEASNLFDEIEDWSRVRSPARAARRRRRGFPQRIVIRRVPKPEGYVIGGTLFLPPETAAKLRAEIAREAAP